MILDKVKNLIGSEKKTSTGTRHVVALDIGTVFVKALICKINGTEAEGEPVLERCPDNP